MHIDLLQRFGEDLLDVVNHLEEQGIPHRDIKPDNIAVGMVGRGDKLHVVLFDFSLSRTPAENIRAGTTGYLDPLLPLRKPPRWDLHAERYAAAMTLYEMATGTLPQWGDGTTDPSHLPPGTEITINAEAFDPGLREALTAFFQKAFRRDVTERFDNAEEMLTAWRECFKDIERAGADFRPGRRVRSSASCWPPRPTTRRSPSWGWARGPPTPSIGPTSSPSRTCSPPDAAALAAAGRRQRDPAGDFRGRKDPPRAAGHAVAGDFYHATSPSRRPKC